MTASATDTVDETADSTIAVAHWLREPERLTTAFYQRPYVWDESLVTSFVKGLLSEDPLERITDLGLVVLEKTPEGGFAVSDGQQRLVTFALLLKALSGECLGEGTRCATLLRTLKTNAESLYRLGRARQVVDALAKGRIDPTRLDDVTMGVMRLGLESGNKEDAKASTEVVRRLYEDANTTGLLLTGGQVLKATHYGVIVRDEPAANEVKLGELSSDEILEKLEAWRRKAVRTLTDPKGGLRLDHFVDANAWDHLGKGFAQGVFSILNGDDPVVDWWIPMLEKWSHLDPLEAFRGNPAREGGADLPWRADRPLDFTEGLGYFRMLETLLGHYEVYVTALGKLDPLYIPKSFRKPDDSDNPWEPGSEVRIPPIDEAFLAAFFEHTAPKAPLAVGELIVKAALIVARVLRLLLNDVKARLNDQQAENLPFFFTLLPSAEKPIRLLGIESGNSGKVEWTRGSLAATVFASALCWSDRFNRTGTSNAEDTILRLVVTQLLTGTLHGGHWYTIWTLPQCSRALACAKQNRTVESAWWAFKFDWEKKDELAEVKDKLACFRKLYVAETTAGTAREELPNDLRFVLDLLDELLPIEF